MSEERGVKVEGRAGAKRLAGRAHGHLGGWRRAWAVGAIVLLAACSGARGRADDALKAGRFDQAAALYRQVLAKDPKDAEVKGLLVRAERGHLDALLAAFDARRTAGDHSAALEAARVAIVEKGVFRAESLDAPRVARLDDAATWCRGTIRDVVKGETDRGHALAGRARREAFGPWLALAELAPVAPELDRLVAEAGARTCVASTAKAGEQPFALAVVAAYCKRVGGPMPPWRARPLLVSELTIEGDLAGSPAAERPETERVVASAVERSVWYAPGGAARARAVVGGSVGAAFTARPTELTRSWTERVPYRDVEQYQESVQVPYTETEHYTEQVPYTDYETVNEPCPSGRGVCPRSRPVTRYRSESRTRQVTRTRTETRERTRPVTRYRDEPRVFRFQATKHEGRYEVNATVVVQLGQGSRPVTVRHTDEHAETAFEHDAEFEPAGVHPERGELLAATAWRSRQRAKLGELVTRALDAAWLGAYCTEAVASVEEAARCAHARPNPAPQAVLAQLGQLVDDDPELVLRLPRPGEAEVPAR